MQQDGTPRLSPLFDVSGERRSTPADLSRSVMREQTDRTDRIEAVRRQTASNQAYPTTEELAPVRLQSN